MSQQVKEGPSHDILFDLCQLKVQVLSAPHNSSTMSAAAWNAVQAFLQVWWKWTDFQPQAYKYLRSAQHWF